MARIDFDVTNKGRSIFDEEKFELKKDQVARIVCLENDAEMELIHWVTDTGYVVCHGDYQTVMENGGDPSCPACRAAKPKGAVGQARRRFVVWILQYRTNNKGEVSTPVTFDLKPWIFADDKFNTLVTIKNEWGDLRKHDLIIKCISGEYQKFEISPAKDALWLKDPTLKALGAKAFKERPKDSQRLLGRTLESAEFAKAVAAALGEDAPQAEIPTGDIGDLLGGGENVSADDLLGLGSSSDGDGAASSDATEAASGNIGADLDFDSILGL